MVEAEDMDRKSVENDTLKPAILYIPPCNYINFINIFIKIDLLTKGFYYVNFFEFPCIFNLFSEFSRLGV